MISKSQQNMAILDEEIKFTPNMSEMSKKSSSDKIKCEYATSPSAQTEEDKNLVNHLRENSKRRISENSEIKSNEFQSETRIQLSFSVDRLLSDKLQHNKKSPNPAQHSETHGHDQRHEKCCDELSSSYSCCSLPNCLVNSTSLTLSCKRNSFVTNDEELATAPAVTFMDFKSVVRPTAVRALGNTSETVSPLTHFSCLPTNSLNRFQHAHVQQQKQLTQHLPAQSNFTLSSLMNPVCGLKPLQMSAQQHLGLHNFSTASVNRLNSKVNFDIPLTRPNLACISTLRHHPLTTANSNESHLIFNNNNSNTTSCTSIANTVTTNTNSGNSHRNVSSGKRKRSWSRAVFSNLQRKGLEIQFQQQKYITKPDRRKLAARLNLTDAQVKVWFQNRRMKWRHTRENLKSGQEKQPAETIAADILKANIDRSGGSDLPGYSSDGSSSLELSEVGDGEGDDEIDVVE